MTNLFLSLMLYLHCIISILVIIHFCTNDASFPWLQGGSCFHNVIPASISEFHKITIYLFVLMFHIVLWLHLFSNLILLNLCDVLPYTAHLHLSDASSFNREDQIGDGLVPLSQLFTLLQHDLSSRNSSMSIIPEIWQGHVNNGHGFQSSWNALVYTYEIYI